MKTIMTISIILMTTLLSANDRYGYKEKYYRRHDGLRVPYRYDLHNNYDYGYNPVPYNFPIAPGFRKNHNFMFGVSPIRGSQSIYFGYSIRY